MRRRVVPAFVFLLACQRQAQKHEPQASPEPGASVSPLPSPSASPPDAARSDRWSIYCSAFAPGNALENCWMHAAMTAKDGQLCAHAGSIRADCATAVARATGNAAACEALTGPRDVFECFTASAIRAPTDSPCAGLRDGATLAARCLAGGLDEETCSLWTGPKRDEPAHACSAIVRGDCAGLSRETYPVCVHHVAVRKRDVTVCRALHVGHDPVELQLAENKCLADVAVGIADLPACAAIPHGASAPAFDVEYDICLSAAAARAPAACDRVAATVDASRRALAKKVCLAQRGTGCPDTGIADCLVHKLMTMTDRSLCAEAGDTTCLLTVALQTRDRAACTDLVDPAMKSACERLTAR